MKRLRHYVVPSLLIVLVLASATGCTKGVRARRLLKTANSDFAAEKYDEAEVEYRNVLHLIMSPQAIGQLGLIFAKDGRINEAATFLGKALEMQPQNVPWQVAMGQTDLAFHKFTNSTKLAMQVLSVQPTNEEALLLLVDTPAPPQQTRQALQSLPSVAENPAYHLALAQIAMREKDLAQAESELRQALAANPKSSQAHYAMGEIQAYRKDAKGAAASLQNAAAYAPMRSPIRLRYAEYLRQSGNVEGGRKVLQEMVDKAPDYLPAWAALMNLALAERKYDDASRIIENILSRDDRNYDALMGRASISLGKGDPAKAAMQLEQMESIYKKSPQIQYDLAVAYIMAHDKIKGIATLNQVLAMDPAYSPAVLLLGQLDIRGGDSASAISMLTQFIKKSPGVGQAQLLLGEAYQAQQKPDSALAVYRKLAEALPKNPQIPFRMGIVLAGQHRLAEAYAAFEKAFALAPDYTPALEQMINLDLAQRKYKDAAALAQAQTIKFPKASEPWELLAKVDVTQTNLVRAETDLTKAIELDPNLPEPYLLLAEVYIRGDKYKDALQKLETLVAKTNSVPALLQIGAIHEQLKEYEPSTVAYEQALKINPESIPALNNLAYIDAVRLDKIDRAFELAQKARELRPYDPNVADTLGWILYRKGDYGRALSLLQEAAERAAADSEIQFHLGMTHYMMDEEDSARMALERAANSPLDFANKDESKVYLAVLNMNTASAGPAALEGLEKALKDHPDDPVILNRIGTLQEQLGDTEKAADTFETALKRNPDAIHIIAKLARLYATVLNKPDKAMSMATDAHKIAPDSAEINAVLGHLIFRTGDYDWALSLLENAADRLPDQPEIQYDLAWAYYSVGRMGDAENAMQRALQSGVRFTEQDDAKRFMALNAALTSVAKAQAAASEAQKVLQSDPKYVPALMVAGLADDAAGNFKAAQEYYSKALETYPKFAPAARQLAILDARHFSDDVQGYAAAEKARTAYPDDSEVAKSLGILSYYQTKYQRSAELLQEALPKNRDDGQMYYYLGMDYCQLKRTSEGKKALGQALALKIPDNLATEAKRVLAKN